MTYQNYRSTTGLWVCEKELICALPVIDMEFLATTVIRPDKGPIDFVIHDVSESLSQIGGKRIVVHSDNEPVVKEFAQVVALHREDETVVKETSMKSSQSIGCNEHDHFLVGGMAKAHRIDMGSGGNLLALHAVYSWILRHSSWLLNRFCVGRDSYMAFQMYKGKTYNSEICDLFECILSKVLSPDEAMLDDQFCLDVWIGKTSRVEDQLIFDGDDVRKCRTEKRRPEYLRWDRVRVDAIVTPPQQARPPRECILRDRPMRYMDAAMIGTLTREPLNQTARDRDPRTLETKGAVSTSSVDEAETELTSAATSVISNAKSRAVHGGIFNCKDCVIDGPSHSKERRECFESIFWKEDEKKAPREAPGRGGYFVDKLFYHHRGG